MRNFRSLLAASLAVLVMAGCEKGEEEQFETITFESVTLGDSGGYENIFWGAESAVETEREAWDGSTETLLIFDGILHTEQNASLGSYYADEEWGASWGGFAFSSNFDQVESEDAGDVGKQFYAYASSATKFAVGYDMNYVGGSDRPVIKFSSPKTIISAMIANSNQLYSYCKIYPKGKVGKENIECKLVATGYKGGKETGKAELQLVGNGVMLEGWTKFSLESLGEVDEVVFAVNSNDIGDWGDNAPAYFCIDNIKIK